MAPRLFHLVAMARQNLYRAADRVFGPALGVSGTQVGALFAIKAAEGGTLKNLTRQLQLKNSAVTGLVQRMVEAGLIRREPSPEDGRAGLLFTTDKGRAVVDGARPLLAAMNARLMAGFSEDDLAVIVRFLTHAAAITFDEEQKTVPETTHQYLTLFQQLGPEKFSAAISTVAPYFSSIDPEFVALSPGHAEVRVRNQRKVHNHIGTVHAIALCNAAELAAGVCTDVSIPAGARWLPVGMTVQYVAKAKTDIRVVTEAAEVDWSVAGNIPVPLAGYDTEGTKVFSAVITMNVKH